MKITQLSSKWTLDSDRRLKKTNADQTRGQLMKFFKFDEQGQIIDFWLFPIIACMKS